MAASALCPRMSWKLSLSSTFKPGGQAAAFNTLRMVLPLPRAAVQSKSTRSVYHRPLKPLLGLQVLLHPLPSFLLSMELTFAQRMLKRYGINPKTRSRDGYAVKLHPLTSCDSQSIADALAHSTLCEAPHTRYPTKPWTPRNLRRRDERCSRKQQNSNTGFTRKSSATLSVLFTQPTKQSVVFVMTRRHVGCFRFLETENTKEKLIHSHRTKVATDATSKLQVIKDVEIKS